MKCTVAIFLHKLMQSLNFCPNNLIQNHKIQTLIITRERGYDPPPKDVKHHQNQTADRPQMRRLVFKTKVCLADQDKNTRRFYIYVLIYFLGFE